MLTRITGRGMRRMWSASAHVMSYSNEYGSAPASEADALDDIAKDYDQNYRLKQGDLGLLKACSAVHAGPGVAIAPAAIADTTPVPALPVETSRAALPLFVRLTGDHAAAGEGPNTFPVPTTRFTKGTKVIAVGHPTEAEEAQHPIDAKISPGVISEEAEDEYSFVTTTADLGPGSFIVEMEDPTRLCGVVLEDGTILSAKDPWFVVNWVANVLPALVTEETARYPPPVLQYINDVKRVIVKNESSIPSMHICQNIFVKNSIEDFKYFVL